MSKDLIVISTPHPRGFEDSVEQVLRRLMEMPDEVFCKIRKHKDGDWVRILEYSGVTPLNGI